MTSGRDDSMFDPAERLTLDTMRRRWRACSCGRAGPDWDEPPGLPELLARIRAARRPAKPVKPLKRLALGGQVGEPRIVPLRAWRGAVQEYLNEQGGNGGADAS